MLNNFRRIDKTDIDYIKETIVVDGSEFGIISEAIVCEKIQMPVMFRNIFEELKEKISVQEIMLEAGDMEMEDAVIKKYVMLETNNKPFEHFKVGGTELNFKDETSAGIEFVEEEKPEGEFKPQIEKTQASGLVEMEDVPRSFPSKPMPFDEEIAVESFPSNKEEVAKTSPLMTYTLNEEEQRRPDMKTIEYAEADAELTRKHHETFKDSYPDEEFYVAQKIEELAETVTTNLGELFSTISEMNKTIRSLKPPVYPQANVEYKFQVYIEKLKDTPQEVLSNAIQGMIMELANDEDTDLANRLLQLLIRNL